jgi:predicted  nucleic acid-binding Zn-ribbon protein
MTPRLGNADELSARISKVKLALIDVERGLEEIRQTGEYDPKVEAISSTLQDIPTSTGAFPPAESQPSNQDGEQILSALEELADEVQELHSREHYSDENISDLISTSEKIYDSIDELQSSSTARV